MNYNLNKPSLIKIKLKVISALVQLTRISLRINCIKYLNGKFSEYICSYQSYCFQLWNYCVVYCLDSRKHVPVSDVFKWIFLFFKIVFFFFCIILRQYDKNCYYYFNDNFSDLVLVHNFLKGIKFIKLQAT